MPFGERLSESRMRENRTYGSTRGSRCGCHGLVAFSHGAGNGGQIGSHWPKLPHLLSTLPSSAVIFFLGSGYNPGWALCVLCGEFSSWVAGSARAVSSVVNLHFGMWATPAPCSLW
jgi:hypothetical protein